MSRYFLLAALYLAIRTPTWAAQVPSQPVYFDLFAIEVNGQQVSRGAMATVTDSACLIEAQAVQTILDQHPLAKESHDGTDYLVITPIDACRVQADQGLVALSLPAQWLKERSLRLGGAPTENPLDVLFTKPAARQRDAISALPSLHIDLLGSRESQQVGLGGAIGAFQYLISTSPQRPQDTKASADWLWASGAALRLGDQVIAQGAARRPLGLRGLSFTNRLEPLRNTGHAQGQVLLDQPARLQFFNMDGQPLFATGLLPSGRYRLEGLGAPSLPGLIEVRLEGVDGQMQSVLLPWVSSPKLLAPEETYWDIWLGHPQSGSGHSSASELWGEGHWARGLNLSETLYAGLGLQGAAAGHAHIGITTQRWPKWLIGSDVGINCLTHCTGTLGLQMSTQPISGLSLLAGYRSNGKELRVSIQKSLSPKTNLVAQWSKGQSQVTLLSLQHRLSRRSVLQLSGRVGQFGAELSTRQTYLLSLQVSLDPEQGPRLRRRLSTSIQQGSSATSTTIGYQQQLSPEMESPRVAMIKGHGPQDREELQWQKTAHWGDLSFYVRRQNAQADASADFSLASRLWLTPKGIFWGPVGEHNLVIHDLGQPGLKMTLGRQTTQADATGRLAFGRTPAWAEASFRVDPKSIPFDTHWKGGVTKLPTASRRAYWVDQREKASLQQQFRLNLSAEQIGQVQSILSQSGRSIGFTPEGYLDLESLNALPLQIKRHDAPTLETCAQSSTGAEAFETIIQCSWSPYRTDPYPPGRRPGLREASFSPPPSSG